MTTPLSFQPEALLAHQDFLRNLARSLLSDEATVEDVLQETWITALTRPPEKAESLRSWLARVVHNRALNWHRGERHRIAREHDAARSEGVIEEFEIESRLVTQRKVVDAVLSLRDPYRTVVYLRWCDGLSPKEIARQRNSPLETVRSQLKRGLEMMRTKLDKDFGDREAWSAALVPIAFAPRAAGVAAGTMLLWAGAALLALVPAWLVLRSGDHAMAPALSQSSTELERATVPLDVVSLAPRSVEDLPGPDRGSAATTAQVSSAARPLDILVLEHGSGAALAAVRVTLGVRDWITNDRGEIRIDEPIDPRDIAPNFRDDADGRALDCVRTTLEPRAVGTDRTGLRVELAVGPTFELELEAPRALAASELLARLGLPSDRRAQGDTQAGVHAGARPWVRFAEMPRLSLLHEGQRSAFELEIATRDGELSGSTLVHAQNGRAPGLVHLVLAPCVELRGQLVDERGASVSGARIAFAPRTGPRMRVTHSDASGAWRLGSLALASGRLIVNSSAHEALEMSLDLGTRERTPLVLQLASRPAGRVAGTLDSRTGTHVPSGAIVLRSTRDPAIEFRATATHLTGSAYAFEFASIPHGEYELFPPMADGFGWSPATWRVLVPGPSMMFTCLDDVSTQNARFRVFDALTNEPIERFAVAFLVDRYDLGRRGAARGDPNLATLPARFDEDVSARIPRGVDAWWLVEAEGYMSLSGSSREMRPESGELVGEVKLRRAWSCDLWIGTRDDAGHEVPLVGAKVATTGGKQLGQSLSDGRVHLETLFEPGSLAIQLPGWRIASWEGFMGGRRRAALDLHHVLLEREPR